MSALAPAWMSIALFAVLNATAMRPVALVCASEAQLIPEPDNQTMR